MRQSAIWQSCKLSQFWLRKLRRADFHITGWYRQACSALAWLWHSSIKHLLPAGYEPEGSLALPQWPLSFWSLLQRRHRKVWKQKVSCSGSRTLPARRPRARWRGNTKPGSRMGSAETSAPPGAATPVPPSAPSWGALVCPSLRGGCTPACVCMLGRSLVRRAGAWLPRRKAGHVLAPQKLA